MAALRIAAAIVATCAAIAIVLSRPPPFAWLCVAAALAVSVFWLVNGARARRRAADAAGHRIVLSNRALTLLEGSTERSVPWDRVEALEVDEEKLVVRIDVAAEPSVVIEPRYGQLGVYDLAEVLRRAWEAGRVAKRSGEA